MDRESKQRALTDFHIGDSPIPVSDHPLWQIPHFPDCEDRPHTVILPFETLDTKSVQNVDYLLR